MRSPADVRRLVERAARAVALVALGALLWRHREPSDGVVRPAEARGTAALGAALERATRHPVTELRLRLDSIPGAAHRDWLAAIAASGSVVRWRADSALRPAAVSTEALPDPQRRVRVTALAASGTSVAVRDAAGLVDSAAVGDDGVRVVEGGLAGDIAVHAPGIAAGGRVADSLLLRPVLVLARAGWEGKFTVAALEESGWRVESRLTVAPGAVVRQGAGATIDTSRYAAVVVLDGGAVASAPSIARFVRAGGGAVLTPEAARAPALAAIAPARAGDSLPTALGALATGAPRRGLAAVALRPSVPGAVVVERRGSAPVAVAARVEMGRVLMLGYAESWRWRMSGGDGSDAAHRAWWSAMVASVARAPRRTAPEDGGVVVAALPDGAPWVSMIAAIGAAERAALPARPASPARLDALLFALALAGLLAEWVSRRTRGAR